MFIDTYENFAEFYDITAAWHVPKIAGPLAEALSVVEGTAGPVLEIGAGTGRVTEVIAKTVPQADIIAAEPSVPMRAVLTSRVFGDPHLRDRVTVLEEPAPHMRLPDHLSGVVLVGVLGHLTDVERADLWARLGERLAPGAPIVVDFFASDPSPMPLTKVLSEPIGEQTYEWWVSSAGLVDGLIRYQRTWKVIADGEPVRSVDTTSDWVPLNLEQLAEESGLTARRIGDSSIGVLAR
ncbi:class I SAM-dependent methyltransferase [Nocardia donostiensis]|uniref:Methyltransferase domain-containing protein n=1 Tax=Nocardia donostiensis TaxID=1538463 RepID=A0A1W0B856_9NOCA|nr:class I SAM-dependent methyltransferase [Nocardia donostiensis]ONM46311.1 hypothetical protein B0T46_23840 [Nocardia donostiensis]OQS18576.1 hypothetical protein B0T44_19000 [Nocardia donostiensis]